jgi:hypothetical protein
MKIPKLCKQKRSRGDRAYVKINRVRIYCGLWGTPQSEEKYQRLIAEWNVTKQAPVHSVSKKSSVTVSLLVNVFLESYAKENYVKNGRQTSTYECVVCSVRELVHLYGSLLVDEFSHLALETLQQKITFSRRSPWGEVSDKPLARKTVNDRIKSIRHIFKWGVGRGLVDPMTHYALMALPLLK